MNTAIEHRHRQNRCSTGKACESKDQETAKEQLNRYKINPVTDFIQYLEQNAVPIIRMNCYKSDLRPPGINAQKIRLRTGE